MEAKQSKVKLSKAQKSAVELMRGGTVLLKFPNAIWLGASFMNPITFWALVEKKIIERCGPYGDDYILTNLGKTIEL